MKKAIVMGATGFIGKYLVKELIQNGYEVWAVARSENSDTSQFYSNNIHLVYCDLKNIQDLPQIISERGFNVFFQLAWEGHYGAKREDYTLQLENAISFVKGAEICPALGCQRFIGAGSVTELMYRDYLAKDGATPDMVTCYAIGKMTTEYMCRCVCSKNGTEFVWPYISNFYGVGDKTQNFVNFLIDSYAGNNTPNLTSGEQLADFMYVSDVAKALVNLGEKGCNLSTYYVGYGKPRPLKTFVKEINRIVNPKIESGLGRKAFNGMDIKFASMDIDKLERETGFQPCIKFEEGIKMLYEWRIENRGGVSQLRRIGNNRNRRFAA